MGLGDPLGHPAYAQPADTSIDFAENRTTPVATFFAYDQDGDAISWSLGGPDGDRFTTVTVVGGWTPIAGASSAVYTPKPADVGRCLRATARYVDNVGRAVEDVGTNLADDQLLEALRVESGSLAGSQMMSTTGYAP